MPRELAALLTACCKCCKSCCCSPYCALPQKPEVLGIASIFSVLLSARVQHDKSQRCLAAHAQEENLRSGLLLEQGALCLLHARPPRLRKFAFHMTLAGLRFNACDQKVLGARAYRRASACFWVLKLDAASLP